ncbi:hypothetical protein CHS0354_036734 [Potamilus streckersoni]|uniref:Phosphomevalonate kinase n=1 Tax=Potamilus streckersoni TaxID=2493646 RepID=A0AAE0TDH0_9BIVA|nr:hypothetical protein CHS0354_036734 [Potamilus streckersoni]
MSTYPSAILVFNGKRKSGKDFISVSLQKRFGEDKCAILRLSGPLKKQYAKEHNLDFDKLLDASEYKEKYRAEMIKWGEEKRRADPGYFCRLAVSEEGNKPIWIISDARRKSDVDYFQKNYRKVTQTVRIMADENVRIERGYQFTKGIDDAESECGLDIGMDWDIVIYNNGDNRALENKLDLIVEDINMKLAENKL